MIHWIVYQTTCLSNGKIYIGVHGTSNLNDTYLGSGVKLREDIAKLGRAAFKREVLYVFDNPEEMFAMEAELVTGEFCFREDTYNVARGGNRGVPRKPPGMRVLTIHSWVPGDWDWFDERARELGCPLSDLLLLSGCGGDEPGPEDGLHSSNWRDPRPAHRYGVVRRVRRPRIQRSGSVVPWHPSNRNGCGGRQ